MIGGQCWTRLNKKGPEKGPDRGAGESRPAGADLLTLDLLADDRLPVVAGHIMEFHPVPVSVVQNCQAAFSSIWLGTSSPGETARIPAHLTPGPEVGRPVCGEQPQEVL